jgi:hypothetical protein
MAGEAAVWSVVVVPAPEPVVFSCGWHITLNGQDVRVPLSRATLPKGEPRGPG